MTSKSKLKGTRIENLIVKLHQAAGIKCRRVPLSGALGGDFSGDLDIGNNLEFKGEVKSRKTGSGFKTITGWLGENNFLFLHENYKKPMIVMTWEMYETLIKEAQKKETPHDKKYRPF